MKILLLDIETAPNLAYVWGMWKQNINLDALVESGYTMCWAAKWLGEKEIMFDSIYQSTPRQMVRRIHKLINEADVVIHFNGTKFDMPTLNKEFLLFNLKPPSNYKEVDLLKTCRRKFRFPSNKLDYVAKVLGLKGKFKHIGYELWTRCMALEEKAWKMMERYNKQDVKLLEQVYYKLLPWIPNHPNVGLYSGEYRPQCRNCGSTRVQKRGVEHTASYTYKRYVCLDCGKWQRGTQNIKSPCHEILI